jgi:hypothetical protein
VSLAPDLDLGGDLALHELELTAPACFWPECVQAAAWYCVLPHDRPCSVTPLCDGHQVEQEMFFRLWGPLVARWRCQQCLAPVSIGARRWERIN